MPRAHVTQERRYLVEQEGGLACSLSRAWESSAKLGRAKMYLGSGQTCPAVSLNFNRAPLSGREEAVLEALGSSPPAHAKRTSLSKSGQSQRQWPRLESASPAAGHAGDEPPQLIN